MSPTRRTALITGVLFIITFVVSIPAAFYFYAPVLNNADYIAGAGADTGSRGRAARGHPHHRQRRHRRRAVSILKRQNEGVALGYVASRIVESTVIAVGIVSLLRS